MGYRTEAPWSSPLAGDGGRQRPAPVLPYHQDIMTR